MKIIDLSMSIQPHWRWNIQTRLAMDHKKNDPFQVTVLTIPMHAFTHVDTPLHIEPDRITIDQVSLERFCGTAAILDLSDIESNMPITAGELEKKGGHISPGDIVILKTAWDLKRDWTQKEYWLEAPFVREDAAEWLAGRDIKAVGFDFPQDYAIREIPARHPPADEMPTHHLLLRKGVYLIEYLCNVHQIASDRATVYALPLKVKESEGAPARVIAVVD
ncbi:MAG: cyclase family protein [Desulfobacteraceae bacterium]|nr:MAG: cyclase family protein [Desulfobacteraceae bacterium]